MFLKGLSHFGIVTERAGSNASLADYLVKRGSEAKVEDWGARSNISEEAEAVLLDRGDRLIDLRLAEHCLFSSTLPDLA